MLRGLRRRLAIVFTAFTGAVLAGVLAVTYYLAAQQVVRDNELWFSRNVDTVASTALSHAASGAPVNLYTGGYVVAVRANGERPQELVSVSGNSSDEAAATPALTVEEEDRLFQAAKEEASAQELSNWVFETYSLNPNGRVAIQIEGDAAAEAGPAEPAEDTEDTAAAVNEDSGATAAEAAPAESDEAYEEGHAFFGTVGKTEFITVTMAPAVGSEGVFTLREGGVSYRATYFSLPVYTKALGDAEYEFAVLENLAGQRRGIFLMGLLYLAMLLGGLALLYVINWFLARLVLRPTEEGVRRQTEFVAAASHELRSPLTVIRASLSAAQTAPDEAQAEKYQTAAAQEAERMTHLVDDLLLLAGGDAGSWTLHEEPVDLDTLLIDAAEVHRPLAKDKGVGLKLELPEETLPQVKGDAERLRQILGVLMDNALQYAPACTDITLSARSRRGKVRVEVADRGRGVPDGEKEKVFQRFYRADASRHDKEHFGLGLSVAQELAQLHGGSLAITDTKDGGATFVLTLPADK